MSDPETAPIRIRHRRPGVETVLKHMEIALRLLETCPRDMDKPDKLDMARHLARLRQLALQRGIDLRG